MVTTPTVEDIRRALHRAVTNDLTGNLPDDLTAVEVRNWRPFLRLAGCPAKIITAMVGGAYPAAELAINDAAAFAFDAIRKTKRPGLVRLATALWGAQWTGMVRDLVPPRDEILPPRVYTLAERRAAQLRANREDVAHQEREATARYTGPGPGAVIVRQWLEKGPNGPEAMNLYSDGSIWPAYR